MLDRSITAFVPNFNQNRLIAARAASTFSHGLDPSQQHTGLSPLSNIALPRSQTGSSPWLSRSTTAANSMRTPIRASAFLTTLALSPTDHTARTSGNTNKRLRSSSQEWPAGQGFAHLSRAASSISDNSDTELTAHHGDKHLTRAWDNFWSNEITAPNDYARRHIVMTKVYKNCISAMRHHVTESGDPQLERNLKRLYATCLNDYKGTTSYSETDDLKSLEKDLFHTLHNLRFNIFLGDGIWNSAMSDSATMLKSGEDEVLADIAGATDHEALDHIMRQWFDTCVDFDKSFKIPAYERAREGIRDDIQEMIFPENAHSSPPQSSLAERKDFMKVCVISFYDSLTCDPSEAQHPALRRWQNSELPQLHGAFLDLTKNPDLTRYGQCLKAFFNIDQTGAKVLGMDLKDLSADDPVPASVARFQTAITQPRPTD